MRIGAREAEMAYENILYEKKDGIAYITFNRPKVLNALNRKTVEELQHALLDARNDESVRVLILTGAGEKAFVAGADIGELALQTPVNGKEFSLFGQGVFHLLEAMAKKIIANGPIAVKFTMEAIERGVEMAQEEGLFLEATLFGVACATEDMREGTKAVLEKRPPQFKGK